MMRTMGWVVGALVLAGGLIWAAQWWQARTPPAAPQPPLTQAPEPPLTAPSTPKIEHPIESAQDGLSASPPQATLDASDPAIGESLANLFDGRKLPDFVQPINLIRNIVATIDNLPRKKAALRLMPVQPTPGAFTTGAAGDTLVIAPDNTARYDPVIALVEKVNSKQLVAVYVRFYPLFQQAYSELGYPDGYFNDRLVVVIDHLLATPDIKTPIELVQPKVQYQYADPALESLSAGQKAMIRIGPEHAGVLKAKLREIRNGVTGSTVAR